MRGLLLKETSSQPKVQRFLESIARNSIKTKNVYKIGLSYFQTFLSEANNLDFTLETLLDALGKNKINIYEVLDDFVSYIINKTGDIRISSRSLHVYQKHYPSETWILITLPTLPRCTLGRNLQKQESLVIFTYLKKRLSISNNGWNGNTGIIGKRG